MSPHSSTSSRAAQSSGRLALLDRPCRELERALAGARARLPHDDEQPAVHGDDADGIRSFQHLHVEESRLPPWPGSAHESSGSGSGRCRPGEQNAITDVPGVRVGHATIVAGDSVRTGVTVVHPHEGNPWEEPVFAGPHRLNGNGELTGLEWVRESGMLTSPIGLTNTHSVGVVHDALIAAEVERRGTGEDFWSLPVVGETWDGPLNDINGMHVRPEHALEALVLRCARTGTRGQRGRRHRHDLPRVQGRHRHLVAARRASYVVGVLVQANYGRRERLRVDGVPVGLDIPADVVPLPGAPGDASRADRSSSSSARMRPLLPGQCERARAARRARGRPRRGCR